MCKAEICNLILPTDGQINDKSQLPKNILPSVNNWMQKTQNIIRVEKRLLSPCSRVFSSTCISIFLHLGIVSFKLVQQMYFDVDWITARSMTRNNIWGESPLIIVVCAQILTGQFIKRCLLRFCHDFDNSLLLTIFWFHVVHKLFHWKVKTLCGRKLTLSPARHCIN